MKCHKQMANQPKVLGFEYMQWLDGTLIFIASEGFNKCILGK